MSAEELPSRGVADATWDDVAMAWDENPDLFEGVRGRRVAAYIIDFIIELLLIGVLWIVGLGPMILTFGALFPVLVAAVALVPFAYHTLCIGGPWHATVGMKLMGLSVIATDGTRPDYFKAAIQTGVFLITVAATQFLVVLVSFFNDQARCLHDYLAATMVVNDAALSPSRAG